MRSASRQSDSFGPLAAADEVVSWDGARAHMRIDLDLLLAGTATMHGVTR